MSVSVGFSSRSKQKYQTHPHSQLLKSIMDRLDFIQNHQMKTNIKTSLFRNETSANQYQKLSQNMKIIVTTNIDNLKRLQQNTKQNLEQMFERIKGLQSRTLRILKQKQQAMQYLQYRVLSVQNSQKNVTQFMKKVAQRQTQKYSGVYQLQERIKQIQQIFLIKNEKQHDDLIILQQKIRLQTSKQTKIISQQNKQQVDLIKKQIQKITIKQDTKLQISAKKEQVDQSQLQQLANRLKIIENQSKQQKRKNTKLQQLFKQNQRKIQQVKKNLQSVSDNVKNITKKQYESNKNNLGTKTQYNDHDDKNSHSNYSGQKKTQPSYLKPTPLPPKSSLADNKNNPYDILTGKKQNQKHQDHHFQDRSKKSLKQTHQQQDDDPFSNMVGGIRGLLRKSKQKQVHPIQPSPKASKKPLPRQQKLEQLNNPLNKPYQKNLPPVKNQLKRNSRQQSYANSQDEEQEAVYQVDEEGYLLDEDGNYLYDEDGRKIQLSQEQMYDIMQEQN